MDMFTKRKDAKDCVLVILFPILIFFSALEKGISPNNVIYAIGQIREYDTSVFNSNIYMSDGSVSPRYVLDKVFSFFMHLNGGNWQNAAVPYVYFGVVVLGIAMASFAYRLTNENRVLFASILAFMFIANVCGQVGGFSLFLNGVISSIGMGMGFALITLSISFVIGEKKNFNIAWIIVAIASLMHIHEGIYGFCTIFIILIIDVIHRKISMKETWTIVISIAALLMVAIPNMLTDTLNISNEEFVYIYATYRHPHHLVPSTWGVEAIFLSLLLIILAAVLRGMYLCFENRKEDIKFFCIEAVLFLAAWVGALAVMYIGTERLQLAAIATIFIVKFFKYVGLIAIIWYVKTSIELFNTHNYVLGFGVLAFAFSAKSLGYEAILVCLLLLIWFYFSLKNYQPESLKGLRSVYVLLAGLIFSAIAIKYNPSLNRDVKITFVIITFLFACWFIWKERKNTLFKYMVLCFFICLILVSLYGDFYEKSNNKIIFKTPTKFLQNSCGDIYELANSFESGTGNTDEYLANPNDIGAGWLQAISRRNCYVLNKVIPSSKSMIKEWYERYQLTQGLFDKTIEDIINIMNYAGIEYLLVDSDHFSEFDDAPEFDVYTTCQNDSYRMYKLVKGTN